MTAVVKCRACGEQNMQTDNYCHNCGAALPRSDAVASSGERHAGQRGSHTVSEDVGATGSGNDGSDRSKVHHEVAYRSDIGTVHHVNQDAGGAWTWTRSDGTAVSLVIVADGVSAGRRSEDASRLAVDTLYTKMSGMLLLNSVRIADVADALLAASRDANHEVARRPHQTLGDADATTLVAVCVIGREGAGVWCGDSRAYCLDSGVARRLTRDHSWAEQVVLKGLMSVEEAARDQRAHMITRWLGPPDQDDPGLEVLRFHLRSGEIVLCCSDGLYGYFAPTSGSSELEMSQIIHAHDASLAAGIEALVQLAIRRGGRDNITAGAIRALSP